MCIRDRYFTAAVPADTRPVPSVAPSATDPIPTVQVDKDRLLLPLLHTLEEPPVILQLYQSLIISRRHRRSLQLVLDVSLDYHLVTKIKRGDVGHLLAFLYFLGMDFQVAFIYVDVDIVIYETDKYCNKVILVCMLV